MPLDNRREWYRYHHLFGELLQHELALGSPEEVPELHRRAAAWHIAEGSVDDAIGHAAAAGDLAQAADLIAASWAGAPARGWTATTQRWLELLPPGHRPSGRPALPGRGLARGEPGPAR